MRSDDGPERNASIQQERQLALLCLNIAAHVADQAAVIEADQRDEEEPWEDFDITDGLEEKKE